MVSAETSPPSRDEATHNLARLYPVNSVLARIVDLTRRNTDLPASAALFGGYSHLGASLAQTGFTLHHDGAPPLSPNAYMLGLGPDDCDIEVAFRGIAQAILRASRVLTAPTNPTPAVLFLQCRANQIPIADRPELGVAAGDSATFRGMTFIVAADCGAWIQNMHRETKLDNTLRDWLTRGYNGGLFYLMNKQGTKISETPPVHLGVFAWSPSSRFFALLGDSFFTSTLVERFVIVLARDRPQERRAIYSTEGFKEAAATWAEEWSRICRGPRAYSLSKRAVGNFETWWSAWCESEEPGEASLRHHGSIALKYALVVQTLINPTGVVDGEAMEIALAITDRHLKDLRLAGGSLASECKEQRLMRKVEAYMLEHPGAMRRDVMQNVRGAKTSARINAALDAILEMTVHESLWERARELRRASRG
jgi:hypothetical protein